MTRRKKTSAVAVIEAQIEADTARARIGTAADFDAALAYWSACIACRNALEQSHREDR